MPNDQIEELDAPEQPLSAAQAERRASLLARERSQTERHEVLAEQLTAEAAFDEAARKVDAGDRRGLVRDAELGIIRGTVSAISNAAGLVQSMSDWLDENVADLTLNNLLGVGSAEDPGAAEVLSVGLAEVRDEQLPQTERITGMVAEPIQQYVMGFMLTRRAGSWARNGETVGKAGQIGVMMGRGAVADFTAFHEHQERLSNMVQANPWLDNPVTAYLAADEDDGVWEGRLKNAIEGAGIGGLAEGLFLAVRAYKGWSKARAAVKREVEADIRSPRMEEPAPSVEDTLRAEFEKPPGGVGDESSLLANDVRKHGSGSESISDLFDVDADAPSRLAETLGRDVSPDELVAARAVVRARAQETLAGLPDQITVYRGGPVRGGVVPVTLSRKVAERHAAANGGVFTETTINKADVLADVTGYLGGRRSFDEAELLISADTFKKATSPLRKEIADLNAGADAAAARGPGTVPPKDGPAARPPPEEEVVTSFRKSFDELRADPLKLEDLVTRIKNGDWSSAEGLVGFNIDHVDLRALARGVDDDGGEAIRKLINTVGEELESVLDFGSRSWGDTSEMADTIYANMARRTGGGIEEVKQFFGDVTGGGALSARYLAAERFKYGIAKAIRAEAKKGLTDIQGELGALELVNLMGLVQAMIRGSKGEAGRLLNSMKQGRVFSDLSDDVLREAADATSSPELRRALMHKLATSKNLEELTDIGQRTLTAGIRNVMQAQFIQGLLSGPGTLVLNTFSNSLKAIDEAVIRAMAVPIGATREAGLKLGHKLLTGKTYKGYDRETWGSFAAFMKGSWQGLRMALEAPVAEITKGLLKGSLADAKAAAQAAKTAGKMGTSWTAFRHKHTAYGNPHEMLTGPVKTKGANIPRRWERIAINWTTGYEYPLRGIIWGDDLHKSIAYHQSVSSASVRIATHEAKLFGHDAAWQARRAKQLETTPTGDMIIQAHKDANYATFQSPLQIQIFKDYERMLQNTPELRLFTPFYRTPAQLIRQGIDRTPVGLVRGAAKHSHEGDKEFARGILGSMTMVAAYSWYTDGKLVGSRRNTLSTRNSQDFDGIGSYSANPVGDRWIEISKFDPLGFVVGMTADYFEMMEHWQNSPEEKEFIDKFFGIMSSMTRQFADKSWFQGVTDVLGATTAAEGDRTRKFVTSKAVDLFTPYQSLGRRLTLREQEFMREQNTVLEQLWATYGFIFSKFGSEDPRAIKHDALGRPLPRQTYLGGPVMSPVRTSREHSDVVSQEIARAAFEYTMPDRSMDGIKLDAHEYNRFLFLRGQYKHEGMSLVDVLEEIVTSDEWPDMTGYEQEKVAKKAIADFGKAAKVLFLTENEAFLSRWRYHNAWPVYREKPSDEWPEEFVTLHREHLERNGLDPNTAPRPGSTKRRRRFLDDVEGSGEIRQRTDPSDWSLILGDAE